MSDSYIKLTFLTEDNTHASLTIKKPDPEIDDQVVKDAMNAIIASGVILTDNGKLVSPYSAQLVVVEEDKLV